MSISSMIVFNVWHFIAILNVVARWLPFKNKIQVTFKKCQNRQKYLNDIVHVTITIFVIMWREPCFLDVLVYL